MIFLLIPQTIVIAQTVSTIRERDTCVAACYSVMCVNLGPLRFSVTTNSLFLLEDDQNDKDDTATRRY